MKRIFLFLLILCVVPAFAQQKEKEALQKKLAKSSEDIANPKKAADPKTWIVRAEMYVEMYDMPLKNVIPGMSQQEIKLLLKDQKINTTETKTMPDGRVYEVLVYDNKKLYFDETGRLSFWEVTDKMEPYPLMSAYECYQKAYELDTDKKNAKKITQGLSVLIDKMNSEALSAYNLEDYKEALHYFEASLASSGHAAVNRTDTMIVYYAAVVAQASKDMEKAAKYLKESIDLGYTMDGNAYAYYADVLKELGREEEAINYLNMGITKYPQNQSIVVSLINTYLNSGDDPMKVIPFIKTAQENEPTNHSLYYAEATVYEKLNQPDKALELYKKSIEIEPNYFFGQYGVGAMYFNKGVDLQNKASEELDDAKYEALMKQANDEFKEAIPYLEKAYELNKDEKTVVDSLKSIYFRFRNDSQEMMDKYNKYNELSKTM